MNLYFSFTIGIIIWPIFISVGRKPSRLFKSLRDAGGTKKRSEMHKGSTLLQSKYHLSSLSIESGLFYHHCHL